MDTRGADSKVAQFVMADAPQCDVQDERFSGFGHMTTTGGAEYAGSFVHGRRHGYGTMVWPDGLKYVGEWAQNVAVGVGCLSWPSGAVYIGQVHRGRRHGNGVYRDGRNKYVGEWVHGQREGFGMQLTPDATYCGLWRNGRRHGWGSVEFASLNRYSGEWADDQMQGFGTMLWVTLRSSDATPAAGDIFKRSAQNLNARLKERIAANVGSVKPGPLGAFTPAVAASTDTLEQYSGEWRAGKPHGEGEYKLMFNGKSANRDVPFDTINRFKGSFVDGQRHGKGTQYFADGTCFEGTWEANLKHGEGVIYSPDGTQQRVVMHHDTPSEESASPERGGRGIMAILKIESLLDADDLDDEERIKVKHDLGETVARASNTLHHLFNVYGSIGCPVDFSETARKLDDATSIPAPPFAARLSDRDVSIPLGATGLVRNAIYADAMTSKIVADASRAVAAGLEVMHKCNSEFDTAMNSSDLFASPTNLSRTDPSVASSPAFDTTARPGDGSVIPPELESPGMAASCEGDGFASPLGTTNRSPSSLLNARAVTPKVGTENEEPTLESLLPSATPSASTQAKARGNALTISKLVVMLHDAQLLDSNFTDAHARAAVEPLMRRLRERDENRSVLGYPAFVECIIRIADARIGTSYPFFTSSVLHKVSLAARTQYIVNEFLWPLCAALRDMDFSTEFVGLGVDRYVFESSENSTVDEIRKQAVRTLRDKNRGTKGVKGPDGELLGASTMPGTEQPGADVVELDDTVSLSHTIAELNAAATAAGAPGKKDRPSSAAIDSFETMDLPHNATTDKMTAAVKYKLVLGEANAQLSPLIVSSNMFSPKGAKAPAFPTTTTLELWCVVVTVRHASGRAVHQRCHGAVVELTPKSKALVGVVPCAVLHRWVTAVGARLPAEVVRHVLRATPAAVDGGAKAANAPPAAIAPVPTWMVPMPLPVPVSYVARFTPVAAILEANLKTMRQLHAHCQGRLHHLLDLTAQMGLLKLPAVTVDGRGTDAVAAASPRECRKVSAGALPVDIAVRNILYHVFGTLIEDYSTNVTSVPDCATRPVYDAGVLTGFLRRCPELSAALQLVAVQDDARREQRIRFRNLRTRVGQGFWWTVASTIELTLSGLIEVLVCLAQLVYAAPGWDPAGNQAAPSPLEESSDTPIDEAIETSSSVSGGTSATAVTALTKASKALATVQIMSPQCAPDTAVSQFASAWPEMLCLPRRSEFLVPAGDIVDRVQFSEARARSASPAVDVAAPPALEVAPAASVSLDVSMDFSKSQPMGKLKGAVTAISVANALGKSRSGVAPADDGHAAHGKDDHGTSKKGGKAADKAPEKPAPKPAARLGPPMKSETRAPPPIRADKPWPVKKRSTPLEDPKKKRAGKK